MTETIILAPGASPTELLRTLARQGKNTLGVRIMNAVELSKIVLSKSGISIEETYLSIKEEPAEYAVILRDEDIGYFRTTSYADAENLASAIDSARKLLPDNEEKIMSEILSKGEFEDKNAAILSAYQKYMEGLKKSGRIDNISIIRKAIENECEFEADFLVLKEFPLSPIEKKLINTISAGKYKEISLVDFSGKSPAPLHIDNYVKAYGASNEAEWIIGEIFEKNIPIDNCVVAVTDTAQYSQLFYDLCALHNIPVTFGCGLPVSNSYPATILKLLNDWNTVGFNGIDALRNLILSEAFDRKSLFEKFGDNKSDINKVIKMAGNLRICFNEEENKARIAGYEKVIDDKNRKILECVNILASEFAKGPVYIVGTYSVIRKEMAGRIDRSALELIRQSLVTYLNYSKGTDISEITPKILASTVCSENSREGCLFVTGIKSAINTIRENLYIAGASSAKFPGSPKENYLLLDSDYLLFGDADKVPGSENRIRDKKIKLDNLINFASANGNKIIISWPGFDLAEIKEANPSSVLFEYFSREYGEDKTVDDFNNNILNVGFFDKKLSIDTKLCKVFCEGKEVYGEQEYTANNPVKYEKDRVFSPSKIETFITCPRRFYLANVIEIPETEEDDPFSVIASNDFGTVVHSAMEILANSKIKKDEFIAKGKELFNNFLSSRPVLHKADVENSIQELEDCLETAYDKFPKNEVISAEEKMTVKHPSGITLRGIPDRIEKRDDGTYIVADFKTGINITHKENNIATCIQTLLYAFMVKEKMGIDISECEYRYLRSGQTVKCINNEHFQEFVSEHLKNLANALDNSYFPANPGKDNCKYCKFGKICANNPEEVPANE